MEDAVNVEIQTNRGAVVVVPGSLETRTGGYEYDRRIIAGLRALGWRVTTREIDGSFPRPTANALTDAAATLAAFPDRTIVVIDGLALAAMPEQIERESSRLRIVALVHLPLADEIGLDPETAGHLRRSESRALAASALVVVTGRAAVAAVEAYRIPCNRLAVIEPGTDPAPLAHGSENEELQLLCVATVNRGKGHAILFRALASIASHRWRLTCAGSLVRDTATVQQVRDQLHRDGLNQRVTLTGELDWPALAALYHRADLFVLATLRETYGMAVAEALARGLPVVSTRTGAIPDLVGDDAGVIVSPGDEAAFAEALAAVVIDSRLRSRLAGGARAARDRLRHWMDASRQMSEALASVSPQ